MASTQTDRLAGASSSVAVKAPVRVATTAAITLSGLQTIDGVTVVADDRVLVKNQASSAENGIYVASTSSWARATDWDGDRDAADGSLVLVRAGSTNGETLYRANAATYVITPGVTAVTFTATAVFDTASAFILDLLDDPDAATARATLGATTVGDALFIAADAAAARTAIGVTAATDEFTTGDIKLTIKTTADSGWVMCDDGTIGKAGSGATTRANADTEDLYVLLWTNVSDTYAPVSSGRGATALDDFNAGKTIALTKMLGRTLGISGAGSGLTSRALGLTVGAETHQLDISEVPAHTHTVATHSGGSLDVNKIARGETTVAGSQNTGSAGGGGSHNNMQPTSFINAMIKL